MHVVMAACLALASCGSSDDDTSSASSSDASASAAPSSDSASASESSSSDTADEVSASASEPSESAEEPAVSAEGFPRTITDALGEVEVAEPPMRVVALDQSLLDIAFVLGLEVVGHTTFMDPDGPIPELYGDVGAELGANSVWTGDLTSPNLEVLAGIRPDMILTSAVRHQAIASELSQIAPTVMSESAGAGWKESLLLIAEATGREDVATEALAAYEARAAAVGAAINETYENPTVSIVRFVDVIRLYQPNSFSGTVFADAGLARPESQQEPEDFITIISEEELPLADADWLIYAIFPNEDVEAAVEARQGSPLWNTLAAVQADRAFPVADDRWMSGVGLFGANAILDDLLVIFDVEE